MVGEHLLLNTPYLCTLRTPCMSRGNKAVIHCLKSYRKAPVAWVLSGDKRRPHCQASSDPVLRPGQGDSGAYKALTLRVVGMQRVGEKGHRAGFA